MFSHLIKKALILLISLWTVVTGTFFLMHAIPGDPFIGDRAIPEEVLKSLYAYFGLDQPIGIQYFKYLNGLVHGDLGPSIIYQGRPVNQFIKEGLPVSAQLGAQALLIAVPCGILLGTWAAMRRGRWQDQTAMILSTLGVCVPNFVLSTFLQYIFSMKLSLLPVALWGDFEHTILPTLALAAMPMAVIARLTRSNMVEVLEQDYIKVALAKGIPLFRVSIYHGLRNALLPVIAYLGPVTSYILTGSFMVEKIFALPGLGQWMIQSIQGRDYPMIMGLTIFFTTLLLLSSFLVDLLYTLVDPRLRAPKRSYA
jgi:ABC-type dipeptide/oligopeptide/nickel transport system permease component